MKDQVWSGDLSVPEQRTRLLDVYLQQEGGSSQETLSSKAQLTFLAIVPTSHVPLHHVLSAPLELQTANEKTQSWLSNVLLVRNEVNAWIGGATLAQSTYAILFSVKDASAKRQGSARATQLLIYAASPPKIEDTAADHGRNGRIASDESQISGLQVYALPLCSEPLKRDNAAGLCTPPEDMDSRFAAPEVTAATETRGRKRDLSAMFEDAAANQKSMRRKAGESIAKLIGSDSTDSSDKALARSNKTSLQRSQSIASVRALQPQRERSQHSRSSSIRSIDSLDGARSDGVRPGGGHAKKRSGLSRSQSMMHVSELDAIKDVSSGTGILDANKATLSKIVMAGMRVHGLQQPRKRPLTPAQVMTQPDSPMAIEFPPVAITATTHDDEEFKSIYSQTFKSASFALRRSIKTDVVSQSEMQDVVDRLLELFCTDLSEATAHGFAEPSSTPPIKTPAGAAERSNAFDLPTYSTCKATAIVPVTPPRAKLDPG